MTEKSEPTILAITVHRNDLGGLKRTCASFDAQTYRRSRQLVVDGASTDGSVAWLETAGKSPRRHFDSRSDSGIFDAMNRGVKLAQGDIVTFLNAGDQLPDPDTFAFVADSWSADNWRWAVGAIEYIDPHGSPTRIYNCSPLNRRRMELGRSFIPHPGSYFELGFLRELGEFDQSFSVAADQEFLLRALEVHAPKEWDRIMSLFECGGASGVVSQWETQRLLHRIRGKHNAYLWDQQWADAGYGAALAAFRTLRSAVKRATPGSAK